MVTTLESRLVQALLDRLDHRIDEPCNVPGCVHVHESHEVMRAAA